jgi:hypothetical protein
MAYPVLVRKCLQRTSGLALVGGTVKSSAAVRAPLGSVAFGQVHIDEMKQLEDADTTKELA